MIRTFTHTEVGGHAHNEDAFVLRPHPDDPQSFLGAVADGQGGRPGGGAAAQCACETFLRVASQATLPELMLLRVWDDILAYVDRTVADDAEAGFTTLVTFCIAGDHLAGASCGDSALAVAAAQTEPLILTSRQSKNPPVGSGAALFVPFSAALSPPWTVLALTDGVWKYTGWDTVLKVAAGAPDEAIRSLRQRRASFDRRVAG